MLAFTITFTLTFILVSMWTYVALKPEWTWCRSRWDRHILATRRLALASPIFLLWSCFLSEINLKQLNRYCGPIINKYLNFSEEVLLRLSESTSAARSWAFILVLLTICLHPSFVVNQYPNYSNENICSIVLSLQ